MGYGQIHKTVYKHTEDKFPQRKAMWEGDSDLEVQKDDDKDSDWIID